MTINQGDFFNEHFCLHAKGPLKVALCTQGDVYVLKFASSNVSSIRKISNLIYLVIFRYTSSNTL